MRVLLVEDDPRLVETLGSHLRAAGYAVDVSLDGIEGPNGGHGAPLKVPRDAGETFDHPFDLRLKVVGLGRVARGLGGRWRVFARRYCLVAVRSSRAARRRAARGEPTERPNPRVRASCGR